MIENNNNNNNFKPFLDKKLSTLHDFPTRIGRGCWEGPHDSGEARPTAVVVWSAMGDVGRCGPRCDEARDALGAAGFWSHV